MINQLDKHEIALAIFTISLLYYTLNKSVFERSGVILLSDLIRTGTFQFLASLHHLVKRKEVVPGGYRNSTPKYVNASMGKTPNPQMRLK